MLFLKFKIMFWALCAVLAVVDEECFEFSINNINESIFMGQSFYVSVFAAHADGLDTMGIALTPMVKFQRNPLKNNRMEILNSCTVKSENGMRKVEKFLDYSFIILNDGKIRLNYIANKVYCDSKDRILKISFKAITPNFVKLYCCKEVVTKNGTVQVFENVFYLTRELSDWDSYTEIDPNSSAILANNSKAKAFKDLCELNAERFQRAPYCSAANILSPFKYILILTIIVKLLKLF